MGITLEMIEKMQGLGLFGSRHTDILDIGSSNLYVAPSQRVKDFICKFVIQASQEIDDFAARMEAGSGYDPITGGINDVFVGELFERAGMKYDAIDIADGYKTTILDLNHSPTPKHFIKAYDLVLNFGTTEHLLNQYNAFKVIHDSVKVGGYMMHQLPCVGFSNHGYFTYTPRCMFDLAGHNGYEIVGFWYDGPGGNNDLFAPVQDYSTYFPELSKFLQTKETTQQGKLISELQLPDIALTVIFRKIKNKPFVGALEQSTSVGGIPDSVLSTYSRIGHLLASGDGQTGLLEKIRRFFRN